MTFDELTQDELYHFTNQMRGRSIFTSTTLNFNFYKNMNDPKEALFEVINAVDLDKESWEKYFNYFEKNVQVLCFTMDNMKYTEIRKNIPCGFRIPFLGKGFDHPRMWAQYAVNENGIDNKGICLCINKQKLIEELKKMSNIYKIFHKRIKYVPYLFYKAGAKCLSAYRLDKRDIKKDIIETAKQKALDGHDYLFFRKLSDWRNENEYRFICLCNDEKKISIELNKILKSVIVGYRNDKYNNLIIEYCHKSNIPIYYPQYSYGHIEELIEFKI